MHDHTTLDPDDWAAFRAQAHRMLDDMLDYVRDIRARPVWQPMPDAVRARFHASVPEAPSSLAAVHGDFLRDILPYAAGNVHPGFMGWVHGGGTPVGMLAEMLAAGLNANLGGRDHAPIEVERQIIAWMRRIFGFPESASGLFVTGTSLANLIGVLIARDAELGFEVRCAGVAASSKRLAAYASVAAHSCIAKALDMAGIGSDALRAIPVDARHRISLDALRKGGGNRRHGGHRGDRRPRLPGRHLPRRTALVPRGWRMRRAGRAGARSGAAPQRHRARRFAGVRFSQVGASAL
jgi:hypothetical protein